MFLPLPYSLTLTILSIPTAFAEFFPTSRFEQSPDMYIHESTCAASTRREYAFSAHLPVWFESRLR